MAIKVSNFFATTISNVGGIAGIDTSMTISSSSNFPSLGVGDWTYLVITRASDGAHEIVKATAISSLTVTMTRAQEGTSALAFAQGDSVALWITRQTLLDLSAVPTVTIGTPTGTTLSKSVAAQVDTAGYFNLKAWLVDASTPSLPATLTPPSGSSIVELDVVTDANGLYTFSFDNSAQASQTWYLCVELAGRVYISTAITIGT